MALVSTAALVLALGRGKVRAMTRPALGWTLVAGAFTAGYIVCDAQGVRQSGPPFAYGCALTIANSLLWVGLRIHSGLRLADLA